MELLKRTIRKTHQSLFKKGNLKITKLKSKKNQIGLTPPFLVENILELDNNFSQIKSR